MRALIRPQSDAKTAPSQSCSSEFDVREGEVLSLTPEKGHAHVSASTHTHVHVYIV